MEASYVVCRMQPHPQVSSILISRISDLGQLNSEGNVTNDETDDETDWPMIRTRLKIFNLSSPD